MLPRFLFLTSGFFFFFFSFFSFGSLVRTLVYNDSSLGLHKRGTSEESIGHSLRFFSAITPRIDSITPEELRAGKLKKGDLFVLPGGRDKPYHAVLQGELNELLEDFVREGGVILGICAGAYYFGKEVRFEPKNPLFKVHESRSLSFYPGAVIGPALGDKDYNPNKSSGAHAASIFFPQDQSSHKVFYNGGGYFEALKPLPPHIEVLAHYKENKKAALIKIRFGKGLVILSGVHFEYNPKHFPVVSDPRLARIKEELSRSYEGVFKKFSSLFYF